MVIQIRKHLLHFNGPNVVVCKCNDLRLCMGVNTYPMYLCAKFEVDRTYFMIFSVLVPGTVPGVPGTCPLVGQLPGTRVISMQNFSPFRS